MMMFPQTLIGCPLASPYNMTNAETNKRIEVLRGRPYYEHVDNYPARLFSLQFDMSNQQFAAWQSFWRALHNGRDWWIMDLVLDVPAGVPMECHAVGPYQASSGNAMRHVVSVTIEARKPDGG